jgi:two-component system NtrC family sensor kinase
MESRKKSPIDGIVDDLPIALCVAALPEGELVYANRAYTRLLDARHLAEHPEALERRGCEAVRTAVAAVVEARRAVQLEGIPLGDGARAKPVRVVAHPIFDPSARVTHVNVALFEQLRELPDEMARAASAEHLAALLDHAPIISWAIDASGVITVCRGGGLSALGLASGAIVGQNVFELYRDCASVVDNVRRALAGEAVEFSTELPGTSFDTRLVPIRDALTRVVGAAGISNDGRDLRRLQALAIRNDRMMALGTLAASVAHEINNPLSYVFVHAEQIGTALGKLDAIAAELDGPRALELEVWLGKLREHFATMKTGTERIAAITREVRNFSRPDDDSVQVVDLRGVVHSVQQLIGKKLETLARLSLDLEPTTTVRGNRARLVQVVLNLVVNAIQALPRGSPQRHEIGIRTYRMEDRALLEVSDTGLGVPAADRERIFDPFVTTKGTGEGTGLGLFVCRNIVRAYAGTLVVDDRAGGGALFRVSLPLARASEAEPADPAREAPLSPDASRSRRRTRHVLVIDDDPLVARALCARLVHAGYRASRETDGASGLRRLLSDESIDLAFCDVIMRDLSGVELLAALRAQASAKVARVVFMTGSALGADAQQLELEDGMRLVQKPFDIVEHVERWLSELG